MTDGEVYNLNIVTITKVNIVTILNINIIHIIIIIILLLSRCLPFSKTG